MSEVKEKYNLALALGGGGARGIAHIGVLKALEREKIGIDLIVGTSMGAIVGAMYVQQRDARKIQWKVLSFLDEFLENKKWLKILGDGNEEAKHSLLTELSYYIQRRYLGLKALTRTSLESKESLYEPLRKVLVDNDIEDNDIPFAAVCLDLAQGIPVVLDKGSIIDAVYASAAIEGVFPPLELDSGLLADGGPANITPVEVAKKLGAKNVIAVDVPQRLRQVTKFNNGLEIMMRADSIGLHRLRQIELSLADVVVTPDVGLIHWANFTKAEECISRGEQAAIKVMPAIKAIAARKNLLARIKSGMKRILTKQASGIPPSD